MYVIFAISIGLLTNSLQEQSDKAEVTATEIIEIRESDPCVQKPVNKQGCKQFLKGLANDEIFPQKLVCYIFKRGSESAKACEVALEKRKDKKREPADERRSPAPILPSVVPPAAPLQSQTDSAPGPQTTPRDPGSPPAGGSPPKSPSNNPTSPPADPLLPDFVCGNAPLNPLCRVIDRVVLDVLERAKLPRTSSVFPHEKPKEISEDNEKQQD